MCHEHRAVSQQSHSQAHLDARGIGAVACGSHGCFYPNGVVNFHKGEGYVRTILDNIYTQATVSKMSRYHYRDYIFVNAINRCQSTPIIMLLYDIICKFIINFRERRLELPEFLKIPEALMIKKGIGLFHVHGHIKQCFARYAPTFIRGSGMVAGEIIETLWSSLNHTASSARTMSWYHRQEYLDSHMGDSNWKKLTGMGEYLCSFVALQ